jgi:CheY-like chemotaxis protein
MASITVPALSPTGPDGCLSATPTRRRILVVDDDSAVLEVLASVLESVEADIETCSDPEEALRRFEGETFDLVISDERMPKMRGSEMLRRLRGLSPRTPAILLTGFASRKQREAAYEREGVFCYVAKPFDTGALIGTVREALRAADAVR